MESSLASFESYLRTEVDTAGDHFESARERVFALTIGSGITSGPTLLEATEVLSQAVTGYIHALRRLAHFAAHQARPAAQKHFSTHA
jgi:hypothetical protein